MSGIAVVDSMAASLCQDDQNQYVVAYSVETGEERWRTIVGPAYRNSMGDGPRSTPAIADGRLYAMTGEGITVCLSLDQGRILWKSNLIAERKGDTAEYGMACSPLLAGDNVILTLGLPNATVVALKRDSGELAWQSGENSPAGYSSPTLLKIGHQSQLVVFHGSGIFSVNPQTGREVWSYPYITDYNCNIATPLLVDGNVLISSGENHGAVLLNVPETAGGKVREVWTSQGPKSVLRNEWQTSLLWNGHLYGYDNVGSAGPVTNLVCVDAATGSARWQERRFGKGNAIAADGKLFCTSMEGEVIILAANPEKFVELDRASLIGKTRQAPSLANGRLYVRDDREIVCIDVRKTGS